MCVMQEGLKKPLLLGKLRNNLYFVEERLVPIANGDLMKKYEIPINESKNKDIYKSVVCLQGKMTQSLEKIKLWHLRLRHMPFSRLQILFPKMQCKDCDRNFLCIVCPLGKQTRKSFNRSLITTNNRFFLIDSC